MTVRPSRSWELFASVYIPSALLVERQVAAIEVDLDIDSRRYHRRRFGKILDSAASVRQFVIDKMHEDKDAARDCAALGVYCRRALG